MAKRTMMDVAAEQVAEIDAMAIPAGFVEVESGFVLSKDGDTITGKYIGQGEDKVITKGKGKKSKVKTWNIEREGGAIVNILGAAQIDQFFAKVPVGKVVWMARTGQVNGGKGRVNTYKFAIAK